MIRCDYVFGGKYTKSEYKKEYVTLQEVSLYVHMISVKTRHYADLIQQEVVFPASVYVRCYLLFQGEITRETGSIVTPLTDMSNKRI